MAEENNYYSLSTFFHEKFSSKIFKISIDAGLSCPNKDEDKTGCIYCRKESFVPADISSKMSIKEQIEIGIKKMSSRKNSGRFLAYFQSNTNTYGDKDKLLGMYREALGHDLIMGISIGTRPDCIQEELLEGLNNIRKDKYIIFELGLETSNDETLKLINRGHSYEDFIAAVEKINKWSYDICAHVILGLPGETREQIMNTAKRLSILNINGIKIHHLHVVKGTEIEKMYNSNNLSVLNEGEYISLLCDFLELINSSIVIHRLFGDCPQEFLVAPKWKYNKQKMINLINEEFIKRGSRQGSKFLYHL